MNSVVQRYALAGLTLVIAASAALAALNVPVAIAPRSIFVIMAVATLMLMLTLVFGMIYAPLRDRAYHRLLPHAIVLLLFAISVIKLSITGFAADDEIYSWNLWAIQHFQGKTADFEFTNAPYPQLFSYWIAAIYHAMGTMIPHSVPRFFLALPTLLLGLAVVASARIANWRVAATVSLILIIAFGPVAIRLAKGLADPLMSAAMMVSVMLLIAYAREPRKLSWLWLSLACAVTASLTKQAGLIWACFSLPVAVAVGCVRYNWPRKALVLTLAAMFIAMIWPLAIAPIFTNNAGVISASMGGRSYVQQFGFAVDKYLVHHPEIALLLVICVLSVWRHAMLRLLLLVALLPMLLAWFIFGAYEIRLGIHVLALAGLLSVCALSAPAVQRGIDAEPDRLPGRPAVAIAAAFATAGIFAALLFGVLLLAGKNGTDLGDGAKTTLRVQYGPDASPVFDRILRDKARIWTTGVYAYGPFYGRLPLALATDSVQPYTVASVKRDLLAFKADYAVYSGTNPSGPASELLKKLAQTCPAALTPVLQPPNQYDFILYKVDRPILSKESCE
jgi:hypothetical protein